MKSLILDVIIPIKDRTTLLDCVAALIAAIEGASNIELGHLIVCDGGSSDDECQRQLQAVIQYPSVMRRDHPHPGFNKGWLLNQGIAAATAPILLISDVDILWNAATVAALVHAVAQHPNQLYCIQSVHESRPQNVAIARPRYTYQLARSATTATVKIDPAPPPGAQRPGYGLVCAQRSLFSAIGGYRHDFWGWGWEDQDLLMRAELLGYSRCELGHVIHQSHGDADRNSFAACTPQQSRDRNIRICLAGLAAGRLLGDLAPGVEPGPQMPIHVIYPPELCD
jgi:glycosyltransferase involved in cell wall biosynthesis